MTKLLLLGCIGLAASAAEFAGGPFVVNVTSHEATVVWIVDDAASGGTPALHAEKTVMTGLMPGMRYDYAVPGYPSEKGWFRTPPDGAVPFRFVLYGDNRTRDDVHARVVGTLIAHGIPDFVVQSGDMAADGFNTKLWEGFFRIEKDLLRQTAFFPALGNHEKNTPLFGKFFQKPKPYYSFDWGSAHFAVIDSDIANVAANEAGRTAFWEEQKRWLEEDLRTHQGAGFLFVVAHHPPITAVERRQGDNPQMIALMPMFEKYKVTAGLFGHDHNYQHYLKNGVHYIGSGGGGAPLYDVDKPPAGITRKVARVENFVSVTVNGKTARVQAIDIEGKVIEEFELGGK